MGFLLEFVHDLILDTLQYVPSQSWESSFTYELKLAHVSFVQIFPICVFPCSTALMTDPPLISSGPVASILLLQQFGVPVAIYVLPHTSQNQKTKNGLLK